ncbi:hypothetical protein Phum_PHUM084750 [Pediculus humanus corporis]|uniref:Uncharacterized protein n=1 Tax=Pediculus humanus subsp. corporis TaxID=121224 RepID=E0VCA0_PEDHC|nr:uncharacterized protein Phum_PHUM084750 [Pediculus humanus corporis]EEB11022.1 hypothetical protein Phum_PHUM084750 [Pediculus humanus corporis]
MKSYNEKIIIIIIIIIKMIFMVLLVLINVVVCHPSQKSEGLGHRSENDSVLSSLSSSSSSNPRQIPEILLGKLQSEKSNLNPIDSGDPLKINHDENEKNNHSRRKSKSLSFYPYYLPSVIPFPPPGNFYQQQDNKDTDNSYSPTEWLSRTEPFKKNQPLLDSPTYYIRLPPNPYAFVPGVGYVSRPPSLSDPEVYNNDNVKPETSVQTGNDIYHDPFYRLPINFVSNGKPTSVYQLENDQPVTKPDSNFINLNKGPYVFNGKPSEIYLVAQIYNALYGDELNHFYP